MKHYRAYTALPISRNLEFTLSTEPDWSGAVREVNEIFPMLAIDDAYTPVLVPGGYSLDGEAFLMGATSETKDLPLQPVFPSYVIVRGVVEEGDLQRAGEVMERWKGTHRLYADPPIDTLATCCGDAAIGTTADVEKLLDTARLQANGMDGHDIAVAVVDKGINLAHLHSKGLQANLDAAFSSTRPQLPAAGSAPLGHGTMCAYDALIAAPHATLLDIAPMAGFVPTSSAPIQDLVTDVIAAYGVFFNLLLGPNKKYRSLVVSNSWGVLDPTWDLPQPPNRYIDDPSHQFHQLVSNLTRLGADFIFAAGNCGPTCPSPKCRNMQPNQLITGANSHPEVTTVGGVDINGACVGYSSPGPGTLDPNCGGSGFLDSGIS